MEDRVRAALSVRLTPAADPEPEALIETPDLRILFVHVDFADAAGFDGPTVPGCSAACGAGERSALLFR